MKRQRDSRSELVEELTGALGRADTMLTVTAQAADNRHSEMYPETVCQIIEAIHREIDTAKAISARL